jgi:hypothetical protein
MKSEFQNKVDEIAGVAAEIRADHLQNTSTERYR